MAGTCRGLVVTPQAAPVGTEDTSMSTVTADTVDELLSEGGYATADDMEAGELFRHWKLRTLTDAYRPRPPLYYLIAGLLSAPSLSIVYGGPGSLKSMLLADLCVCVASGASWLEPLPGTTPSFPPLAVNQAPVLWIDFDNGTRRTDERMEAFGRARSLPASLPLHYVSMPTPWLNATELPMIGDLAKLCRRNAVRLVVIDNLGLITGDTEENSAEMARVMGNLRWLCEETEAAVVVVHHQRKSGGQNDKGIRKGETLRGHSSIEAALDLALLIERKDGEDKIAIIPTKVRGYRQFDILGALFTYQHHENTTDLESARFWSNEAMSADEREIIAIQGCAETVLRQSGAMTQGDLVTEIRDTLAAKPGGKAPGINKIRGLLKQMADEGDIQAQGRGTKVTYGLP